MSNIIILYLHFEEGTPYSPPKRGDRLAKGTAWCWGQWPTPL